MKVFRYKGFIGSIEASARDKCLYGKLLYINDLITYEALTVEDLEIEFHQSINEYLQTCQKLKKEPLKPFKGSLNVRIGPNLHKNAAEQAAIKDMSLNEYIKTAISQQVAHDEHTQG